MDFSQKQRTEQTFRPIRKKRHKTMISEVFLDFDGTHVVENAIIKCFM